MSDTGTLGSKERWDCPRGCGWHREWRGAEAWKRQRLVHPEYGEQPNMEIVRRDIENHDCYEYKEALAILHRKQREREKAAA